MVGDAALYHYLRLSLANMAGTDPMATSIEGSEEEQSKMTKETKVAAVSEDGVDAGEVGAPRTTYYSKLSVALMVVFSGLAIGSDG